MKRFFSVLVCVLITLAASAGLLFLVSAPIGTDAHGGGHGADTHAEETHEADPHAEDTHEEDPHAAEDSAH